MGSLAEMFRTRVPEYTYVSATSTPATQELEYGLDSPRPETTTENLIYQYCNVYDLYSTSAFGLQTTEETEALVTQTDGVIVFDNRCIYAIRFEGDYSGADVKIAPVERVYDDNFDLKMKVGDFDSFPQSQRAYDGVYWKIDENHLATGNEEFEKINAMYAGYTEDLKDYYERFRVKPHDHELNSLPLREWRWHSLYDRDEFMMRRREVRYSADIRVSPLKSDLKK